MPAATLIALRRQRSGESGAPSTELQWSPSPAIAWAEGLLRRGGNGRAVEDQALLARGDHHLLAVLDLAGENELGQRILHRFLDHALERAGAVGRVIAFLGEPFAALGLERERDLAIFQKLL